MWFPAKDYPRDEVERWVSSVDQLAPMRFAPLIRYAEISKWKVKPSYMPYPDSSTTLGDTVYLSRWIVMGWPGLSTQESEWLRCSTMLHEATHLWQWDQQGKLSFLASYAQQEGRLRLEKSGVANELRWACATNRLQNPATFGGPERWIRMQPFVIDRVQSLVENYSLRNVNIEALYDWALQVVRDFYNAP